MTHAITVVLLAGSLASPVILGQGKSDAKPQHMDPYVQGPADEGRIIKEVRHQLVMLPYYSIFDDL